MKITDNYNNSNNTPNDAKRDVFVQRGRRLFFCKHVTNFGKTESASVGIFDTEGKTPTYPTTVTFAAFTWLSYPLAQARVPQGTLCF